MRRKQGDLIPLEIEILEAAIALEKGGVRAFHGYSIAQHIQNVADRRTLTAHGTLYRALHRLDRAKLVESFWEDPAAALEEGRPRRRMYRITALAAVALARARALSRGTSGERSPEGSLETP